MTVKNKLDDYISTQDIYRCLAFDKPLELPDFNGSRTKRYKVNAFPSMSATALPPMQASAK